MRGGMQVRGVAGGRQPGGPGRGMGMGMGGMGPGMGMGMGQMGESDDLDVCDSTSMSARSRCVQDSSRASGRG
jgi:hypothetical protein